MKDAFYVVLLAVNVVIFFMFIELKGYGGLSVTKVIYMLAS